MKRLFYLLGTGTLLAAGLQGCKGDAVDLKLNFQPGSKYVSTMETKMIMEQSAMGQTMKTNNDMTMETTYDVAAGGGSDKRITVTYDRIAMAVSNNMVSMAYDSNDPSKQDSSLKTIGNMLHQPFTMTVSDKGEIKQVEGLDKIVGSIGDPTTPEGARMREQMKTMFNDTAVRSMMQQSLNIFPGQPVHKGETWKKTYTTSAGPVNLKIDNTYKLMSVSNGTAHIDVNSKITSAANTMPGMENMKIDMAGDQKGNMDVEVATGLVTDSKLKQNIKGNISAMGMQIPMTITSDIHITGQKK